MSAAAPGATSPSSSSWPLPQQPSGGSAAAADPVGDLTIMFRRTILQGPLLAASSQAALPAASHLSDEEAAYLAELQALDFLKGYQPKGPAEQEPHRPVALKRAAALEKSQADSDQPRRSVRRRIHEDAKTQQPTVPGPAAAPSLLPAPAAMDVDGPQ